MPHARPCLCSIQRILVANPAQRLTIAQIFQHPWVQQVGGGGGGGRVVPAGLSADDAEMGVHGWYQSACPRHAQPSYGTMRHRGWPCNPACCPIPDPCAGPAPGFPGVQQLGSGAAGPACAGEAPALRGQGLKRACAGAAAQVGDTGHACNPCMPAVQPAGIADTHPSTQRTLLV